MAFIPGDNIAQLEAVYEQDGQVVENVWYFHNSAEWDVDSLNALAEEYRDWDNAFGMPIRSEHVSLTQIRVRDLSAAIAPSVEFTDGLPIDGGVTDDDPLPNSVTVSITLLTNQRGRSYRGRQYWVGLTTDQVDANAITVGMQTALIEAMDEALALWNGPGIVWGVASRRSGGADRAAITFTPIVGFRIDRHIDNQRRRLPGRGR